MDKLIEIYGLYIYTTHRFAAYALTEGCSKGLDAFSFFFKHPKQHILICLYEHSSSIP